MDQLGIHGLAVVLARLNRISGYLQHLNNRLSDIERKVDIVTDQQGQLDADVQAENAALDAIETEIANLKNQPGATSLDFTGLDAVVGRLQGDEPAPVTPPVTNS